MLQRHRRGKLGDSRSGAGDGQPIGDIGLDLGGLIAGAFGDGVEGHVLTRMSALLHREVADVGGQMGRRVLGEPFDRLDEESLAVGEGQAERVHDRRAEGVVVQPPAWRGGLAVDMQVARLDLEVGGVADFAMGLLLDFEDRMGLTDIHIN